MGTGGPDFQANGQLSDVSAVYEQVSTYRGSGVRIPPSVVGLRYHSRGVKLAVSPVRSGAGWPANRPPVRESNSDCGRSYVTALKDDSPAAAAAARIVAGRSSILSMSLNS